MGVEFVALGRASVFGYGTVGSLRGEVELEDASAAFAVAAAEVEGLAVGAPVDSFDVGHADGLFDFGVGGEVSDDDGAGLLAEVLGVSAGEVGEALAIGGETGGEVAVGVLQGDSSGGFGDVVDVGEEDVAGAGAEAVVELVLPGDAEGEGAAEGFLDDARGAIEGADDEVAIGEVVDGLAVGGVEGKEMVAGLGDEALFSGAVEGEGVDGALARAAGGEGVIDEGLAIGGDVHAFGVDPVEGAKDFGFAAVYGDEGNLADVVFAEEEGEDVIVFGGPGGGLDEAGFGVFEEGARGAAGEGEDAEFVEAFVVEPGVGDEFGVSGDGGEVGELLAGGVGEFGGLTGGEVADGEVALFDEAEVSAVERGGAEEGDGGIGEDGFGGGGEEGCGEEEVAEHAYSM